MYRLILVLLFFYHASTPAAKSLAVDIQILKKQQEVREHVYFVFFSILFAMSEHGVDTTPT